MARKVTQISPQTLVKRVDEGKQKTVWISGLKIDKYAGDETQHINTYFIEPQEVVVDIGEKPRWGGEYSSDRITLLDVKLPNNEIREKMARWESNSFGIKFFKDEEKAKQYFLVATKNLYDATNLANKKYKLIHEELSVKSPTFVQDLDNL